MTFARRVRRATPEEGAKSRRSRLRERGAAMVEFALISPVFFALLFGGIEMGLMFRSHLAIEDMSRNAARVASIERDNPDADRAILKEIADRSNQLGGEITKVIIFYADTLDAELPSDCIDASDQPSSQPGECNSYGSEYFSVANGGGAVETNGITADQRTQWNNLGIYVEYKHSFVTGFFDEITLKSTTVEVIELDL